MLEHDVFISYATDKGGSTKSDLPIAEKICSALEYRGIRCWMAHRDILPGGDWLNSMIDAVMQCQIMVLVFSSNTNKSPWVVQEVTRALRENKTIIPFKIENVSPIKGLRALEDRCQWMDAYTPPLEKHVDRLVKVVHTYLKKEPERPLKGVEKKPESVEVVEVDVTKEVKKKEKIPERVPQKKWILFAASIIVLVAIVYFFRYQLGIIPEEKSPVKKIDDWLKKEEPVKKSQLDQTKEKPVMAEGKKPQEKVEEMPNDVKFVASKGIKVEKNKKGFWEAQYRDGIVMIYIPAGEFIMGSDDSDRAAVTDEKPPHTVDLDGYWMGKTEVTVGQYKTFISEAGYRSLPDWVSKYSPGDNHPVIGVSWDDAAAYCKWLPKKGGLKFKLPTEAQWEKAARGTDARKYPWGDPGPYYNGKYYANYDPGNYEEDGFRYTAPVDSFSQGASPYGLLNMAGNVWEWCNDWYDRDYYKKDPPPKNPMGPRSGTYRVLRGGGWVDDADYIRCAYRVSYDPSGRVSGVGFRLCQDKE